MTALNFTDRVEIAGTRRRTDGYLVADARVARTGIQRYLGVEVGRPDLPFVDVYRPEAEVFHQDAMASFAARPVTDDHPSVQVTADNWKQLAHGQSDTEVRRDGDSLRVPLMIADAGLIKKIEDGKRELSAGYTCDLVFQDGLTPDGKPYQAIQTKIRANHIAVVHRGRAGPGYRVGDSQPFNWGAAPYTTDKETVMNARVVLVDGLSVETTDQGAQAIEKLLADRKALQDRIAALETSHSTAIATKDADISKLTAQVDDLKGKQLDQAAIDKLVADRAKLEATAGKIAPTVKPAGLSDAALKAAVVKAALGDKFPAERVSDQAYMDARFDILAEDAARAQTKDTFRDAVRDRSPANLTDAHAAREKAFADLVHFDQTGTEPTVN